MLIKRFHRYALAFNTHKFDNMALELFELLEDTSMGGESRLIRFEDNHDETEKELIFLPLNLHQALDNWQDGAKKLLPWAEFSQKYGETVATVSTLGWILAANDYETAIRLAAYGLIRGYGQGVFEYNVPAMILLHIAENSVTKTWSLIWGLDDAPEVRIEVIVDLIDLSVRPVIN